MQEGHSHNRSPGRYQAGAVTARGSALIEVPPNPRSQQQIGREIPPFTDERDIIAPVAMQLFGLSHL